MYSIKEAIDWLKKHGKKHNKIDESKNYYRFRQKPPESGKYINREVLNGILFVIHL